MGPRQQVWVSWSAGAPLIVNIGDLIGILWMVAVLSGTQTILLSGTQTINKSATQIRDHSIENERGKITRRLASIEGSVDALIQQLEDYIEKRGGSLITATRNNTDDTRTSKPEITRKQKWEEKQLYGCFNRLTSDISHEKMWMWLRKGNF